jgi:hypothetical protein
MPAFTKADLGVVAAATTVPFLAGAVPDAHAAFDLHGLIMPMLIAAASSVAGMAGKAALAGIGATLRSIARRWRTDDNKGNDDAADGVEAIADTVDPEHKPQGSNTPPADSGIARGPQP